MWCWMNLCAKTTGCRQGAYVMIAVTDTGTACRPRSRQGIRAVLHHQGGGKGTGLGLSHVHGFVKQSGGHIKIYSEEGHARRSSCTAAASGRAEALFRWLSQPRGAGETILVVEDDALVRGLRESRELHNLGYRHGAAADGRAAPNMWKAVSPSICCSRCRHARRHNRPPASTKSADRNPGRESFAHPDIPRIRSCITDGSTRGECCYPSHIASPNSPASYVGAWGRIAKNLETDLSPR